MPLKVDTDVGSGVGLGFVDLGAQRGALEIEGQPDVTVERWRGRRAITVRPAMWS